MNSTLPQSLLVMWKNGVPVLVDLLSGNCSSLRTDQDIHHLETKEQAIWIDSSADGGPLELTVYANVSRDSQVFTCKSELKTPNLLIPATSTSSAGATKRLSQVPCFSTTEDCCRDIRPLFDQETVLDRLPQSNLSTVNPFPVKIEASQLDSSSGTYLGSFMDSFLVCRLRAKEENEIVSLIDQHALHERIRLEELWKGIRDGHGWLRPGLVIPSLQVELPVDLLFQVSQFEEQFLRLGLQFSLNEKAMSVTHVPFVLKDKHLRDLDRNSLRNDISVFVQEAIQIFTEASAVAPIVPPIIMDWVATAACRGAIMFGDKIPEAEVGQFLTAGQRTSLPFQCAHGRPSMLPVAVLLPPSERCQKVSWRRFRKN
ncbi:hypothetical protein RvY_09424-2 [Ramazzottius varieornatus]|uniref:MutL C-terminal dimerisation domain-containing protein n=1 Tax=Ramazzottius varieornatus TaxID=947166 RepID=A0A1D1VBI4_RAMVA|nr:hypothetical protein RvY_09424-2 [Ramazzottius varieornatus]